MQPRGDVDAWGEGHGHDSTARSAGATEVEMRGGKGESIGFVDNNSGLNPWRENVSSQAFHAQGGGGSAFQVEVGGGGGLESGSGGGEHPAVGLGPRVAGK